MSRNRTHESLFRSGWSGLGIRRQPFLPEIALEGPPFFGRPMKLLTIVLLGVLFNAATQADEGMWPYNRVPKDALKQKYGFDATDDFLERLQLSSVRFNNGGSGAFVSPKGLVATNHHIAADCIKKLSSEKKDYIKEGFYADRSSAELKCPDLELNVLLEIEPVTERVNKPVRPEMSDKERFEAQRSATADIEKDCRDSTLLRCEVVNLYRGSVFDLYKYKKYTDVRLVFAPERWAAFFGGDIDNFTFPRYCLDAAFVRVYEKGRPLEPKAYLPWSRSGASEQDLVFVSGHPGRTHRLLTRAQLDFERDRRLPFMLEWLHEMAAALRSFGRGGEEAARLARDELFRINNSIKAYTGMLEGLRRSDLRAKKIEAEAGLREAVERDAGRKEEFGGAWQAIAEAQKTKTEIYEEYRLVGSLGFSSRLFRIARHLYRMSDELPKPNNQRLPEYRESRLDSLKQQLFSPAPIYDQVEMVKLGRSMRFLRDRLGAEHAVVKTVLRGRHPDVAAKRLVTGTRLQDVELRKALAEDNARGAATSEDPMIELVRSIDQEARRLRKRHEDEVEAVERAQGAKIGRARFAIEGDGVYPDATFTLRLSVGVVKAYREDGRRIAPFTEISGLFERATGETPYILPESFIKAKKRLDMDTPYNLVSTNDITGGNSGSPLINRGGELVGIIFDGNIHSLANDFLYSEVQGRAVSVDSRGILEALRKAYPRARRIVRELTAAAAAH